MPAAKPTKKITRTRAKANENGLLSHNRIFVVRFRMVARRRGLLDDSVAGRLLDNSDIVIGIPPCSCAGGKELVSANDSSQAVPIRNRFRPSAVHDADGRSFGPLSGNHGAAFESPGACAEPAIDWA